MRFRRSVAQRYEVRATWTPDRIADYVADNYEYADADDYDWTYEPAFPVSRVTSEQTWLRNHAEWLAWYRDELAGAEQNPERGPDYYRELEQAYLEDPGALPVILKLDGNKGVMQDGYHRFAVALLKKRTTVPAIVGRKR